MLNYISPISEKNSSNNFEMEEKTPVTEAFVKGRNQTLPENLRRTHDHHRNHVKDQIVKWLRQRIR